MLSKKNKQIKNQKGFSLLIALLVMAVVLVISLAISTLMVSEIKLVGAYDDSVIAYYAADAGIETALLQYKNDQNFDNGYPSHSGSAPEFTTDNIPNNTVSGCLNQDESVEVNLMEGRPDAIVIKWNNLSTNGKESAVEWTLIAYKKDDTTGKIQMEEGNIDKGFFDGTTYENSLVIPGANRPSAFFDSTDYKPMDGWGSSDKDYDSTYTHMIKIGLKTGYQYKLRLKCLAVPDQNTDPSIQYKIQASSLTPGTIGPATFGIGSTGESNGVKRRIEVKNNSGVMGIFDYVLYSEDALNKP